MLKRSIPFLICLIVCINIYGQENRSDNLFPVVQGGKWGYIDGAGKMIIKPKYDAAYPFYDGVARVMTGKRFENEKWSYIDISGTPIFKDLSANRLEDFSEGLGAVCLNKRDASGGILCGYMDKTGSWIIKPEVYNAFAFHSGLARAALPDKASRTGVREVYLDKTGKVAIDLSSIPTNNSEGFSDGLARFAVSSDGKGFLPQGYMDTTGKIVIKPQFQGADDFSEGMAAVFTTKPAKIETEEHQEDITAGFIDKTGKMVIKPQFEFYQPFSEGLAFVSVRGRMGAIDKTGRVVIRPQFNLAKDGASPYFMVLDYYKQAAPWRFSEGLAAVHRGGLWGYIDKTGKFVIAPRFRKAHSFAGGLALVLVGDRVGYIDKSGKFVWNPVK